MGYKNREIEVKLLIDEDGSLPYYRKLTEKWLEECDAGCGFDYVKGNASDLYWNAPSKGVGDFVRLRKNPGDNAQVTTKSTDRKDITNRIEIDLEVDNYKQARILMEALHGDPVESVKKRYHVYILENKDTTVSVYQIDNDKRVFVEIEARSEKRVRELVSSFTEFVDHECRWVKSSIYEMFVLKNNVETYPVSGFLGE